MKNKFYYLKDENNKPIITVCIAKLDNVYARGMSICSPLDIIRKKSGRDKSLGMIMKAFVHEKSNEKINREEAKMIIKDIMSNTENAYATKGLSFVNRSEYQPKLTEFEKKLLNESSG